MRGDMRPNAGGAVAARPVGAVVAVPFTKRLRPYTLFPFIAILAFLLLYPLFMVIYGSFRGGPPGVASPWTIEGYVRAWSDPGTIKALGVTFGLAVPRVVLGTVFAVLMVWVIVRTNVPLRSFLEQALWFRVFLPALPMTLSWVILLSGRTGIINRFWMETLGFGGPLFNIESMAGIVFLSTMMMGSMFYFFIGPAFRSMDASMEESSRTCGASNLTTLRRVTAPLMMPAILGASLLILLAILASYETELLLGARKGIYVFTTYIWYQMGKSPVDYPAAMALSTIFMLFVAIIVFIQFKMLGGRKFVTVTGRGFAYRPTDLGRWRWAMFAFVMVYFLVITVLPLSVLIMGTFQKSWGIFSSAWTLDHWRAALASESVLRSVKNTLILGFGVATANVVVYSLMSYAFVRTTLKGRQLIEVLSWVPRAAPGIVMAVAFVWAILGGIPGIKFLYGTLLLMGIVLVLEAIPTGMRVMNAGMVQLASELEESARVSGASWLQTMRKVVVPLLAPTLVSAWLLGFLFATRTLVTLLFIYAPSSKVLSIDIFEQWGTSGGGRWETAAVLGLMLTGITMVVAIVAQIVGNRARRTMEMPSV